MRHIREAKETDLDKIRKIVLSAICRCVTDSNEHQEFLYKDVCSGLEWWLENKDNSLFLVCAEDDSVLGMALVREFWNFSALFVNPQHHRLGVGRDLVESVIESCRGRSEKGCLRLNSSNHAAGFYRKMGFVQIGDAIDRPGGCVPFEYKL